MKKKRTGIIVVAVLIVCVLIAGALLLFGDSTAATDETVYVQSLSEILGLGYAGGNNRYGGIVEPKNIIKVDPDKDLTVKECFVKAGDSVTEGDPLFSYDVESLTLTYEQLLIDITGIENTILTNTDELASLEKQILRNKNKPSKLYELKLQKQTVELALKKADFELKSKQGKADEAKRALEDSVVKSPTTGRIRSVRDDGAASMFGPGESADDAYITIVAGSDFCVKGTVSEQTVFRLYEGMPVLVRSRTDKDRTYVGEIYQINTTPESNQNMYYYGDGEQTSKYAFYVSLESIDGLLVGQHVYLEPGSDGSENETGLQLPAYYLIGEPEDGGAFVYAESKKGTVEKRRITVGAMDEATLCYEVLEGLSPSDKLAFPDESVRVGMKTTATQYNPSEGGDMGGMNAMPMEEMQVRDVPIMNGDEG